MTVFEPAASPALPNFFILAADPLRWRLLSELGRSDRRVRELCVLLDRPQSLVSYHLAKLSAAGVVSRRKSTADGRDSYYTLDLARCGDLLAASGSELHPGLRLSVSPSSGRGQTGSAGAKVLFLCTGNSARSQIAEALTGELSGGAVLARSAGSHPKPLHPNAVRVTRERGIDISDWHSKHLSEFAEDRFDCVVTVCDRVREVCPEFPGQPEAIHWSIPDPSREGTTDKQTYRAFERTAQELSTRIPYLLDRIAPPVSTLEVT